MKSLNYALVSSLCALVIGILLSFVFGSWIGGRLELFFYVEDQKSG